jgi:hypothetical protein
LDIYKGRGRPRTFCIVIVWKLIRIYHKDRSTELRAVTDFKQKVTQLWRNQFKNAENQ